MKKESKELQQRYAVQMKGQWLFKLPDPVRQMPWLPLDARTLADNLGISTAVALRICKGEKTLAPQMIQFLQMIHFGFIPDPDFYRGRWCIRHGELHSHRLPGRSFGPGDLTELALLLPEYRRMLDDLQTARQKLADAEAVAQRYERLRVRYRETVRELRGVRQRLADLEGPDLSNVVPFRRR